MEFTFSPEEQERLVTIRRAARKLASRQSRQRVIRKLPQTMVVVKAKGPDPVSIFRRELNLNKRLAYVMLLGAVLGAYFYDVDESRLLSDAEKLKGAISVMEETVQEARYFYLGA